MVDLMAKLKAAQAAKKAAQAGEQPRVAQASGSVVAPKPSFVLRAPPPLPTQPSVLQMAAAKSAQDDNDFMGAMAEISLENALGDVPEDGAFDGEIVDDDDVDGDEGMVVHGHVPAPQTAIRRGVHRGTEPLASGSPDHVAHVDTSVVGDDDVVFSKAPVGEIVDEPAPAPVISGIMRRPIGPAAIARRPVVAAPVETPKPAPASTPAAPAENPLASRFKEGSAIGNLLKRPVQITPAATTAIATGREVYSAADFVSDWEGLGELGEDSDEHDAKRLESDRVSLLKKATAELEAIFVNELSGLTVARASDFALKSMAEIVQVTMLRIKDAPTAWALLNNMDKVHVVNAIRAMSAKRNSAAKSRKPMEAKALSAAQHAINAAGLDEDVLSGLTGGDFDIG